MEKQEVVPFLSEPSQPEEMILPASLQRRFAAFVVDSVFVLYLLEGWGILLKYLLHEPPLPFTFNKAGWMLFATSGAAIYFLYHLFFEGVLTATPGKMLSGILIRNTQGRTPSIFSILIRNLFRLIDYPLFPITMIGLMEGTKNHQRLGDIFARTIVAHHRSTGEDPKQEPLRYAGVTRRSLAFVIDVILLVAFSYGLLLVLPTQHALIALIGLNLTPVMIPLYFTLAEFIFRTTFGKAIFGMRVVAEEGGRARFAPLFLRHILLILDLNPLSYLCTLLSSRKQRPGDAAAGIVVVTHSRGVWGWLCIPIMLTLSLSLAYLGYRNPHSFLRQEQRIQVGPYLFDPAPLPLKRVILKGFRIEQMEFGHNPEEANKRSTYAAGDVVYLLLQISGYTVREGRAWIKADIKIRDANHALVLDHPDFINESLPREGQKSAKVVTRFVLHPQATPGTYQLILVMKDVFGETAVVQEKSFTVRP